MKHAYRIKNANLPYGNLITRILRFHLRDIPQRDRIHPTNLFHELPNLGWVNNSIGNPPVWTPNHKYPINSWIKDPNAKVNQYSDPNSDEPFLETEPTQEAETSSQEVGRLSARSWKKEVESGPAKTLNETLSSE
jgi:hypothetical protein